MQSTIRKISGLKEIYTKYSTFFFDLDGVVWVGDNAITKNIQAIKFLKEQQKRVMFISNSSAKGRQYIVAKLSTYGVDVKPDSIYTSAVSTGMYIREYYPDIKKVLVIGSEVLAKELGEAPLEAEHCTLMGGMTTEDFRQMIKNIDKSIDALVVGIDYNMNFKKLSLASLYIQMGKPWFATNRDSYIRVDDHKLPGAGSIISQIEVASNTKPLLVGKPNPYILQHIIELLKLKHSECLMIGDNLHTDIEFGSNAKVDTVCTMTGVTSWAEAEKGPKATYYCEHL